MQRKLHWSSFGGEFSGSNDRMAHLRLFIAVETPIEIRTQIAAVQAELKQSGADVRWEPEEKFHATLKFLGRTEDSQLPDITSSIEKIAHSAPPLSLRYRNLGCFPSVQTPRVIWVGIEELNGALTSLYGSIESAMEALGFEQESRPFHAHITLGRVKSKLRHHSLLTRLETITFESKPVTVREVAIVKSELKPTGSVYVILKSIALGG